MDFSTKLRSEIKSSTLRYIEDCNIDRSFYRETKTAVIFNRFEQSHNPNFLESTFRNITEKKEWSKRLEKLHSYFDDKTKELDSSNSSDALLMNIFCHPDFKDWTGPHKYLSIDNKEPMFGWDPEIEDHNRPTEVDMKIGSTIYEAKLTESDFTTKNKQTVLENYPEIQNIFDLQYLANGTELKHYQLLRNIYAANKHGSKFTLLVDARRPDLIQYFVEVLKSITNRDLQKKCSFITWQHIASLVGQELKSFLNLKYSIN